MEGEVRVHLERRKVMAKITIDEDQYPRNSKVYKEPQKENEKAKEKPRLKPVTKQAEDTVGKAFVKEFIGDKDEINNYIVKDLLIPGIKNGILSVLSMMFFKDDYVSERRSGNRHDYSRDYRRGSSRNTRTRDRSDSGRSNKTDPENIQFNSRNDADIVCGSLRGRIREYGSASIGDLFDLIDVSPEFTDWDFGWTREEDIGIRRLSNGRWLLDVSKPTEL